VKEKVKILSVVASILLIVLLAGCQGNSSSSSSTKVIKVGAILPLDGAWASLGQNAKVALELALESVNFYLQKDNLQIELVVENSSSDAGKALVALQALHARGIHAVIGPMTSDEASALVGYANTHDMLIVSPSSTATSLALPDNLFRMVPNDTNQVEALVDLMKKQNITRLLPVYVNDSYGSGFEQLIRTQAGAGGITVLGAVTYGVGITDFTPVINSMTTAAAGLDPATTAILFIGRDSDAVQVFTGAGVSSPLATFKWFATDSIIRESLILGTSNAAAFAAKVKLEGFTFSSEATVPVTPTMIVTGLMSAKLGTTPSPKTLGIWDALWFVAEAYRLNPTANTTKLIENFTAVVNKGCNFFGETTKLDANGDMASVLYSRFKVETVNSVARWNLKGMFLKTINAGTVASDATTSLTPESGDAVIGVLLPLTGAKAETGAGALKAINLALEHASAYYKLSVGVNINFKLTVRDTGSSSANALAQLQALHAQGIDLIIGPYDSGELAAIQDYAKANGMILISPNSTAPSLAKSDDRIMRLTPDDTNQARAIARLMTSRNKQHAVLIYRNDLYGQDFVTAFSGQFKGTINSYSYEPDTTNFSSVLNQAASRIQALGSTTDTAVLVIGLNEVTTLLEQVGSGPLTAVNWFGTDGISKNRNLLASNAAVATAVKTQLTCSTYDVSAVSFFSPPYQVLESKLAPLLGGSPTWAEISSYDSVWIVASAFAMTRPAAGSNQLWTYLSNLYVSLGIAEMYLFNSQGDQTVSLYTFYAINNMTSSPTWKANAFYRGYDVMNDELVIIEW